MYITGLVRDERGQKMSKSKGNVVDPLEVIDEYGADALRFTLTRWSAPGHGHPLSRGPDRGYRAIHQQDLERLALRADERGDVATAARRPRRRSLALVHRWILHRLNAVTGEVKTALETYRFDVAADRLYHFFWDEYADWYIEMVKQHLLAQGEERDTARAVLLEVHDRILRLLHPIIPFVTEELWQKLPRRAADGQTVCLAPWPEPRADWEDPASQAEIELLQGVVTTIRTARAERSVKPSVRIAAAVEGAGGPEARRILGGERSYIMTLAGLTALEFVDAAPSSADLVTRVVNDLRVHIQMPHADRAAEVEKLEKHHADTVKQIASIDQKLSNDVRRKGAGARRGGSAKAAGRAGGGAAQGRRHAARAGSVSR